MTESKRYDTSIEAWDDDEDEDEEEKEIDPNWKMKFDDADPFLYMQLSNFRQPAEKWNDGSSLPWGNSFQGYDSEIEKMLGQVKLNDSMKNTDQIKEKI